MTAGFDYYCLRYPQEGLKGGFLYKTVSKITLQDIAHNEEIDEIYKRLQPNIDDALTNLNNSLRGEYLTYKVPEGGRQGYTLDFSSPDNDTIELPNGEVTKRNTLLEWEVPSTFPENWPEKLRVPFQELQQTRRAMQEQIDLSIRSRAQQEPLYDDPEVDAERLRVTGPFTVEAVPSPTVTNLDDISDGQTEPDETIARSGETSRQTLWRDELVKTGIRGKNGQNMRIAELEAIPGLKHLHASGNLAENEERVVVSFGPEHAALEQRQVEAALDEAEKLRPKPKYIIFCAFTFDPEAAKDIDETNWPGATLLKAQMTTDLLTEDLKKGRASEDSFWLMGQPDVEVRTRDDGRYEVEVHGFDYFDPQKGELISGGKKKIAMWTLDTDYDNRSLMAHQVFFPMAGEKDGWHRLKKTVRAELDEDLLKEFHGTVSLPFEPGDHQRVAVKIVDDRGIESLKIIPLDA
jgi:adenine-specific DNA-methyltransferase